MMRLDFQEQEECEKVIRGDEPGDRGRLWNVDFIL